MNNSPKLTIIIPTCDRPDTLHCSLATVLRQPETDLEIIVSDNASGPETRQYIETIDDARLRYLRLDERYGMSEHWEFALSHAQGEWVSFLGDDDGFLPGGVARFYDYIGKCDVDALSSMTCSFIWPKVIGVDSGKLLVRGAREFDYIESEFALSACLTNQFPYKCLPWIYTGGFVKRNVIDQVIAGSGKFFSSINPDVYSGIAVASVIPGFGRSLEPFTIEGTSRHSNGAQCFSESRKNGNIPKFFTEGKMRFHPSLGDGFVPSFSLLVYESFLQSEALRDKAMSSTIAEQLGIALLASKRKQWNDTLDYCRMVAEINGIDIKPIERRVAPKRALARFAKIMQQIVPKAKGAENEIARINDVSIHNIDEASRRAAEILAGKMIG
jgi:glycosyltransferase involved in cell wall biosynthesis